VCIMVSLCKTGELLVIINCITIYLFIYLSDGIHKHRIDNKTASVSLEKE